MSFESRKNELNDSFCKIMWDKLTDIPFDEDEEGRLILSNDWWLFEAGTERETIWEFFDTVYSKGVASLMFDENNDMEESK